MSSENVNSNSRTNTEKPNLPNLPNLKDILTNNNLIPNDIGEGELVREEITNLTVLSIESTSLAVNKLSKKLHTDKFNISNRANVILVGENCINIETHWLLTEMKIGFRAVINSLLDYLKEKNYLEITNNQGGDQFNLNQILIKNKIMITDCQKFVLSPTIYRKGKVWDAVFNIGRDEWLKDLKAKVANNIIVAFAYKRIYNNAIKNIEFNDWLNEYAQSILIHDGREGKWEELK